MIQINVIDELEKYIGFKIYKKIDIIIREFFESKMEEIDRTALFCENATELYDRLKNSLIPCSKIVCSNNYIAFLQFRKDRLPVLLITNLYTYCKIDTSDLRIENVECG